MRRSAKKKEYKTKTFKRIKGREFLDIFFGGKHQFEKFEGKVLGFREFRLKIYMKYNNKTKR